MAAACALCQQPSSLARFSIKGKAKDLGMCEKYLQYPRMLRTKWAWLRDKVALGERKSFPHILWHILRELLPHLHSRCTHTHLHARTTHARFSVLSLQSLCCCREGRVSFVCSWAECTCFVPIMGITEFWQRAPELKTYINEIKYWFFYEFKRNTFTIKIKIRTKEYFLKTSPLVIPSRAIFMLTS